MGEQRRICTPLGGGLRVADKPSRQIDRGSSEMFADHLIAARTFVGSKGKGGSRTEGVPPGLRVIVAVGAEDPRGEIGHPKRRGSASRTGRWRNRHSDPQARHQKHSQISNRRPCAIPRPAPTRPTRGDATFHEPLRSDRSLSPVRRHHRSPPFAVTCFLEWALLNFVLDCLKVTEIIFTAELRALAR